MRWLSWEHVLDMIRATRTEVEAQRREVALDIVRLEGRIERAEKDSGIHRAPEPPPASLPERRSAAS